MAHDDAISATSTGHSLAIIIQHRSRIQRAGEKEWHEEKKLKSV